MIIMEFQPHEGRHGHRSNDSPNFGGRGRGQKISQVVDYRIKQEQ